MQTSSKPSVLHVYKDYWPPVLGGVEKCIHWMCGHTSEKYHTRVLVASRSRQFVDEEMDGVRVVRVGCWGRLLSAPVAPGFGEWLKRLDSDIIHFHAPNPTGELAWLLSRSCRGRAVVTYHSDIVRQRVSGALYGPLQRMFLRRMHTIMPTSQAYMESSPVLSRFRSKCRVVPLGIPMDDLDETEESRAYSAEIKRLAAGRTALVFIGVLRYYKGLSLLLHAMRDLSQDCCLFIAGGAPEGARGERGELERLSGELGLGNRVFFLGQISDTEAVGLRYAGDIFCLPSHLRSEAFGLSQIEAMACGLPVVGTDLPGVSEVNRDGETGRIAEPGNVAAFREALADLVASPELRKEMGAAARVRARECYSAKVMGAALDEVYESVLAFSPESDEVEDKPFSHSRWERKRPEASARKGDDR